MRRNLQLLPLHQGSTQIQVFRPGNKNPHFLINGADISDLDREKVADYVYGCDWTDKGAEGYITPQLRCDEFLKAKEKHDIKSYTAIDPGGESRAGSA